MGGNKGLPQIPRESLQFQGNSKIPSTFNILKQVKQLTQCL